MEKILSAKINRKKFLLGWLLLVVLMSCLNVASAELTRKDMVQYEGLLPLGYLLALLLYLSLFNARCNDINGMTTGKKIGIIIFSAIPLIGLVSFLYLVSTRGADYEQFLRNQQPKTEDTHSRQMENLKN